MSRRLLPFLFLCYMIAYIDRINLSVAQLQLPRDVPIPPNVYGFGAGLFFFGYFLLEVPSNLILARVGARAWIARIMIVWGLVSSAMMFVRGPASFCALRFLLGAAEAGFFPGIIYYLSNWFIAKERARAVALFATAGALSGVVGNAVGGALLNLDGAGGLYGWQWLFLLEGIPALALGILVPKILTDRPQEAAWLSAEEREWLVAELERERQGEVQERRNTLKEAMGDPRVWILIGIYFAHNVGGYGFEFWAPKIVEKLTGSGTVAVGFLSAVPYFLSAVVMVLVGRHSDRTGERRCHVALSAFGSMAGFLLSANVASPLLLVAALSLAFSGVKGALGPFWAMPPAFLSGTGSAGGIALINSVGNLGGWAGSWLMGRLFEATGSYSIGLSILAGALLISGSLALSLRSPVRART